MDAHSPEYAEQQMHVLLADLKNPSHAVRIKAVKRFQDYINIRPEVIFRHLPDKDIQ